MIKDTPDNTSQSDRRRFLRRTAASLPLVQGFGAKLAVSGLLVAPMAHAVAAAEPATAIAGNDNAADLSSNAVAGLDPLKKRRLHLINSHTGDDIDVVYYIQRNYIDENIAQLNHLMRDRRANITSAIDPKLYDQLLRLQQILGTTEPVHVLSGYRTPETNAKLRRRSSGVAKYSLHMEGRAADLYIPGIPAKTIHEAALEMQAGGVGLYSKSNFVHLDTGPIRQWGN